MKIAVLIEAVKALDLARRLVCDSSAPFRDYQQILLAQCHLESALKAEGIVVKLEPQADASDALRARQECA